MNQIDDTTQEAAGSAAAEAEGGGKIIGIDEGRIKEHLSGVMLEAVEETLNALLNAEADALCGAQRYERSAERVDTRAGSYERGLHTKAGEVKLKVPKLRSLPLETASIERVESIIKAVCHRADGRLGGTYRMKMTKPHLKRRGYGRRWEIESFFSGLKRTTGSALLARTGTNLLHALRVLAYALNRR